MGEEVIFYIQGAMSVCVYFCPASSTFLPETVLTHLCQSTPTGVDDELDILYDDISTMLTLTQGLLDEVRGHEGRLQMFDIIPTDSCVPTHST